MLWHVTFLGSVLDWLQLPRSLVLLVLVPGLAPLWLEWRQRRGSREPLPTPAG